MIDLSIPVPLGAVIMYLILACSICMFAGYIIGSAVYKNMALDLAMKLNPRFWNNEMHNAWHQNIPNMQKAFDALRKL